MADPAFVLIGADIQTSVLIRTALVEFARNDHRAGAVGLARRGGTAELPLSPNIGLDALGLRASQV
jgi:hypothetical protein